MTVWLLDVLIVFGWLAGAMITIVFIGLMDDPLTTRTGDVVLGLGALFAWPLYWVAALVAVICLLLWRLVVPE